MPYSKEQIQDRYNKLPADIKEAIDSVSTTNAVVDIGEKYDLMYDQISDLVDEVGLTMIGITPEAMFVNNIARRMRVDISKAMLIAKDINKEIFNKMRDSLKKIEGLDEEGFSEENENATRKNNQFGQSEETMMTDAEKAQQKSVISAVEKAGGFVIDKQEDAPHQAEEMVHDVMKENLESKKNVVNILEKENIRGDNSVIHASQSGAMTQVIQQNHAWPIEHNSGQATILLNRLLGRDDKVESSLEPDHLLGDTPESPLPQTSNKQTPTQQATQNQASIVDTLLAPRVAMTMEEPS